LGPDIGSLPNRVIMGSMHTGLEGHSIPKFMLPLLNAEDDHTDLTEMACYFAERAKGGVGLMGELHRNSRFLWHAYNILCICCTKQVKIEHLFNYSNRWSFTQ
jgi:hypothetical protein